MCGAVVLACLAGALSVCLAVWRLSRGRQDLCFCAWALPCGMWCTVSVVMAHRLRCPEACGILVPHPGIKAESPALEAGILTTEP